MNPLRFLHIPKTAGTTLNGILDRQYRNQRRFVFNGNIASDIKRFETLSEEDQNKVTLFSGHASIVTGIKQADNAVMITLLRDPIDRVKSFCQHVSEGKSPYLIRDSPPESFSLDKFLESGNSELSNLQTKMLVGRGSCILPPLECTSATETANLALYNLFNKIECFGLQEHFDESLLLLSSYFHWQTPIYVSKNKKNPRKLLQFQRRHLERIAALNAIDLGVYERAKEHFLGQVKEVAHIEAKLKRFRLINKLGPLVVPWRSLFDSLSKKFLMF